MKNATEQGDPIQNAANARAPSLSIAQHVMEAEKKHVRNATGLLGLHALTAMGHKKSYVLHVTEQAKELTINE